jgi:cold-inducible RNA-binding protein
MTMTRLYIGNLPFSTTDEMLRYIFEHVGPVRDARVVMTPDGRSRGFGFVEMVTNEDATEAIEWFNGNIYEGRTVTVSEARSRQQTL